MTDNTKTGDIIANIEGDISGQVAVGNNILQIGSIHGGVVNIYQPGDKPEPELRELPVFLRPRRISEFLDRRSQVGTAVASINDKISVEFFGEDGNGKTSLLRFISYQNYSDTVKDGIIYIPAREKDLSDVLQFIFNSFYKFHSPIKLQQAEFKHSLQKLNALIIIDDIELDRADLEFLLNIAPECTYVFCSGERLLWEDSKPIELKGLPFEESLQLIERELGRVLSTDEIPLAEKFYNGLNGIPLLIIQNAARARENNQTFEEIIRGIESAVSIEDKKELVVQGLNDRQKRILAVLALFGGVFVNAAHIKDILHIQDFDSDLDKLSDLSLIEKNGEKVAINDALIDSFEKLGDLKKIKQDCLNYFAQWAEKNKNNHDLIVDEADALMKVLKGGVDIGDWKGVIRLGRAIEGAFAVGLLWGLWYKVIQIILQAAKHLGEKFVEAWALHQSGTYSMCIGDNDTATRLLENALEIRNTVGDKIGAEVTRHNLGFISGGIPDSGEKGDQNKTDIDGTDQIDIPVDPGVTAAGISFSTIFVGLLVLILLGGIFYFLKDSGFLVDSSAFELSFSESELSFEELKLGAESDEKKVVVTNNEVKPISIVSVTLDGPAKEDFEIDQNCSGATISPGGDLCTIETIFKPGSEGLRNAKIVIVAKDIDAKGVIELRGEGFAPKAEPQVSPANLDFENLDIGKQSSPASITLSNYGDGILSVYNISIFGTNSNDFRITENLCDNSELRKNQNCKITVVFEPDKPSKREAQIEIRTNYVDKPFTVSLKGIGVEPRPDPIITPDKINFGRLEINAGTKPRSISVKNNGDGSLKINSVDLESTNFKLINNNCTNKNLSKGSNCTIGALFTPKSKGVHTGNIRIYTNARSSPYNVGLRGEGIVPEPEKPNINISPKNLDFGNLDLKVSSGRKRVVVSNSGKGDLKINNIYLTGGSKSHFNIYDNTCNSKTLSFKESCTVSLTFKPLKEGKLYTDLFVKSNMGSSPNRLRLTGVGLVGKKIDPESEYCCYDKKITKLSNSECKRIGGSIQKDDGFTATAACALLGKKESGYCCNNGKVYDVKTRQECTNNRGKFSTRSSDANKNCGLNSVYCCYGGQVYKTNERDCTAKGGKAYSRSSSAKNACYPKQEPVPPTPVPVPVPPTKLPPVYEYNPAYKDTYQSVPQTKIYCCTQQLKIEVHGSRKSCLDIKGTPYYNLNDANAKCILY